MALASERRAFFGEFPRSRERGPIEAEDAMADLRREAYFRAHVSAAPLKQKVFDI